MFQKRKNLQDSTLRNVRAANARIATLERIVAQLQAQQKIQGVAFGNLQREIRRNEDVPQHRSVKQEIHTLKGRFENIENVFYEFFSGIEAAQIAAAEGRPRRGRKR